ncbi:MAG: hypothetical protein M3Q08_00280 [Pseudomonadota bacterium]|nr:hypothetical protein [Pseudomonadota bacterium]
MKRPLSQLCAAGALLTTGGCATFVDSEKFDGINQGIEYSLPIPFIRVTPQPNGTMAVSIEYLPDPANTYVIRSSSRLSSYTLDVQRENGMLKQVSLNAKSDAVAAAVVESAGNVIKAQSDAEFKEQEAAAALVKEQAKALSDAQLEYDVAKAKYDLLVAKDAGDDKELEAELAMAAAKAKLDRLQGNASGGNLVGGNVAAMNTAALQSAAPVLFQVVPAKELINGKQWHSVRLVAVEGPRFLPTSLAAKPEAQPAAFTLEPLDGGVVRVQANQPVQLRLVSSRPFTGVRAGSITLKEVSSDRELAAQLIENAVRDPAADKPTLIVTFDGDIPAGVYFFNAALEQASGEPMRAAAIQVVVQR